MEFSDLCDRVARKTINEEDVNFLNSRIKPCPNENDNEAFKTGKLSIIVTTNMKRDIRNNQMFQIYFPNRTNTCARQT